MLCRNLNDLGVEKEIIIIVFCIGFKIVDDVIIYNDCEYWILFLEEKILEVMCNFFFFLVFERIVWIIVLGIVLIFLVIRFYIVDLGNNVYKIVDD